MKKFFFLLIILFFFLSGDRLISKLLISLTNFSSLPYAKIYTDRAQSDILILGDSRAYHHLNDYDWTKYLRKRVLSISSVGSSLIFQKILLNDYLKQYKQPESIVIELNSLISSNENIISMKYLGLLSDDYRNLMEIFFYNHFLVCKMFNLFFLNTTDFLNVLHKVVVSYSQPYLKGGIKSPLELKKSEKKVYFQSKEYNLSALQSIINNYQDNFNIIFIITPFHPFFLEQQTEMKEWLNELKKIIPSELKIHDYSGVVRNHDFFYDKRHLNKQGVKYLLNIMKKDDFFEQLR